MAQLETTPLQKRRSTMSNVSYLVDEIWYEYGAKDALQHNLRADGTGSIATMDTSAERASSPVISSRAFPDSEPISAPVGINTWMDKIEYVDLRLPSDILGQAVLAEPSTLSPTRKGSLPSPPAGPAASIQRKRKTSHLSTSRASTTLPSTHSGSEDSSNPSLFPCPFHRHNPEKYGTQQWRSCMGPGWNISRLKEHIYRRHCLSENKSVCERCQADFELQSELIHHWEEGCHERSDPVSGKISKSKKDLIHKRRMKMPDTEKWMAIYRILFGRDPPEASLTDAQSRQCSQSAESPETIADFEHYLRDKHPLGDNKGSSERVQGCLDLIQEWREQRLATHQPLAFQSSSTLPDSGFTHIQYNAVPQFPGNGAERLAGVGYADPISEPWFNFEASQASNENCPFLNGLDFNISDEWYPDGFSFDTT